MRILKCQACQNTWIYTGDLPDSCICSLCGTTVRIARAEVVIRWGADPGAPLIENMAVPIIDVYDRMVCLAFLVASEDGRHTRTLFISPRVQADLGISPRDLVATLPSDRGAAVPSGCYPLSPAIQDRLCAAF